MKNVFLTEMGFEGKVPTDFPNMRTEFAWMLALDANHVSIYDHNKVSGYDNVFVVFPKGMTYLNSFAVKHTNGKNPVSTLLKSNLVEDLKKSNSKVHFVQEGPHWLWNDYEIEDQILYYNMISDCDSVFCHNEEDKTYYRGLFPRKKVNVIPTLMIDSLVKDIRPSRSIEKAIIGGNMARWYGGFESYLIAKEFDVPVWTQNSHAMRENESMGGEISHLPRMQWIDWMKALSGFKYAVHMMPTVAAGTFSLNCSYFGIPCIGNKSVDTQRNCQPTLSVNVNDVELARSLAKELKNYPSFYELCSKEAQDNYSDYSVENWKFTMNEILK